MSASKHDCEGAIHMLRTLGYDETLRRLDVTGSALRNAFHRAGLDSPSAYAASPSPRERVANAATQFLDDNAELMARLADAGDTERPAPPTTVDVSGLDYGDEATTSDACTQVEREPRTTDKMYEADRFHVDRGPPLGDDIPPLDVGSSEMERVLCLPDTHRPFHDKRAWALAMKAAREFRPHTVAFLGDFADCFTVSDHDKDPRRGTQLVDEIADVNEGLDEVADLGAERVIFVAGNHEYRIDRYVCRNAGALMGMPGTTIPEMLRLCDRGWRYVPYMSHVRLGKLYLTHDVGHAGIHATHHTGTAFGHNVAFGHTHRLQVLYSGGVTGERRVSACLGWLGDEAEAKYMPQAKRAQWQHGFGIAHMERSGVVHLQGIPIVDGACVVDGKRIALARA